MYEPTPPHEEGRLDVGDGQRLHYEVLGDPDGIPAVVLHGGPGSGAGPWWAGFFDPRLYRVVLLDQRGAGRSTPAAADPTTDLSVNTTAHLVADLERLRAHLAVDRWVLLGGSWGSTLGLTYAVSHPERVRAVVLGAVTLTRTVDVEWLTRGVGRFFPEAHERFLAALPEPDRGGNLAAAYARRLASPDPQVRHAAALAWCQWEEAFASLETDAVPGVWSSPRYADADFRYGFARTATHYFAHAAFQPDDAILARLPELAGIPAVLCHGRLDLAGPADVAWAVARRWPSAELHVVRGVGHLGSGPMNALMVAATDRFATRDGGPLTRR
jgi:proline iminopeptidase